MSRRGPATKPTPPVRKRSNQRCSEEIAWYSRSRVCRLSIWIPEPNGSVARLRIVVFLRDSEVCGLDRGGVAVHHGVQKLMPSRRDDRHQRVGGCVLARRRRDLSQPCLDGLAPCVRSGRQLGGDQPRSQIASAVSSPGRFGRDQCRALEYRLGLDASHRGRSRSGRNWGC